MSWSFCCMFYDRVILLFLLFCGANLSAEVLTYEQALAKCYEQNLEIQKPKDDGRIHTLNKKGASSASFDHAMREFLEYAKGKEVLEIGGC